jgi:CheY-like chemotaxis protein
MRLSLFFIFMSSRPLLALADDDEHHSEMLSGWLQRQGYDVVRFASGDALVSWASSSGAEPGVHAIVMDVDMPGRDGFESCRQLRTLPTYSATPTVFVSSLAGDGLDERAAEAGGSAFIRKDADLLATLASWLSNTVQG